MSHPYASAVYAEIFRGAADPLWVPPWRTHVLVREIPGGGGRDAIGIYPLATFAPDADLPGGLAFLKAEGLVSVGLAPDPATSPPSASLQAAFELCVPFKTHLVVDYGSEVRFSKHHRYEVKKALRQVEVKVVELADHLEAWIGLYAELAARHEIGGIAAFSAAAFQRLARVEGLTAVGAFADGVLVSMHLWMTDRASGSGYSLLAASSPEGYRRSAAYAVYDASIRLFADLKTLNLGAGAGLSAEDSGLTYFKRGFSNAEVQARFCGAILDKARHAELSGGLTSAATPFPAYRFPPTAPIGQT